MKNLHKKISAVILAVILVLPVLSQGFVAYADLNVKKIDNLSFNEFQNYRYVLGYEDFGKYDSLYLCDSKKISKPEDLVQYLYLGIKEEYKHYYPPKKSKYIPIKLESGKHVYVPLLEYKDGKEFLKRLKKGVLNEYRARYEFIVVKVGNLYFQLFLKLSDYQRQRIMVELALKESKDYNFKIECSNRIDSIFGRAEMDDKIMKLFKDKPELMKKLLKEPELKYRFKDPREFASRLELGEIKFMKEKEEQSICLVGIVKVIFESEQGYVRCRIGNYDYVFYYERKDKDKLKKENEEKLKAIKSICQNSHNCKENLIK